MSLEVEKYSLVFQPCEKGIELIKSIKNNLKEEIGWYSSCNSKAHITICEYYATPKESELVKEDVEKVLKYEHSQFVYFDDYASFPGNGAFFIAPALKSKQYLKEKMKVITNAIRTIKFTKSDEPHMTVGRKLEKEKLVVALERFKSIDFDFFCSSIFLRKFNPSLGQYDIVEEFKFGNNPKPPQEEGQLSLF